MKKNMLKRQLSMLMHEIMVKNKAIVDAGDYHNLLSLCEQDISILGLLNGKEDLTAREISNMMDIPKTTIVTAAVRLEKRGYIIRKQNQRDKREMFLLLTDKGKKANDEHFQYEDLILEALTNRWNEEDQIQLAELLARREKFK